MSPEEKVVKWWNGLAAGNRAELRRAKSLTEILLTPAANDLRRRLESQWYNAEGIALIAGALAHVKADDEEQLSARLGSRMSESRFRRLLNFTDHDSLLRPMIRAIRLVEGKANIVDLARSLFWWNDRTRRDWAYIYYLNHKESHT